MNPQATNQSDTDGRSRQPFLPQTRLERALTVAVCAILIGMGWHLTGALRHPVGTPPGQRGTQARSGPFHSRPIIERDGHRLLWARGKPDSPDAEWFDVTDSTVDPERFRHGIGKDKIASIDAPRFVDADDPRLREAGIDDSTVVIGYELDGDARAYPLNILNRHELVNDTVGGKPVTVGW